MPYGPGVVVPVDISGTVVGESPDCLLLSGTVVGENPDHVCWGLELIQCGSPPGVNDG